MYNGEKTTAGLVVYDDYENGNIIHEKLLDCKCDITEVFAYILKKYIINKKLEWHKVSYESEKGTFVLYGIDTRKQ